MPASFSLDLGRVTAILDGDADRAAYAAGEHLLGASNAQVPLEEGDLERSGTVSDPDDGEVVVSYDTAYAVRQHEDLTYAHDPGRNAKYLEQPMHTEGPTMLAIMAGQMKLP